MNTTKRLFHEAWGARTPDKFTELPEAAAEPAEARRGQILIMFAVFAVALMGMLGLATDVGYAMAARRTAQSAADAGAIAGARVIARYPSVTSAQSDVSSIVTSNTFGPTITASLYKCEYINGSWSVVGTCSQSVPSSAVGSRVQTRVYFNTFFIQVVPGVSDYLVAAGYAKARVETAGFEDPQAPFIVCGFSAWDVTSDPDTKTGGTTRNILSDDSPFTISQSAVGKTFRIWDNKIGQNGTGNGADCGLNPADFNGVADQSANAGRTVPGNFKYKPGTNAGPVSKKIAGTEGCALNAEEPYDCVMLLPIATNNPTPSNSDKTMRIVGYAAFDVSQVDSNSGNGVLLDDYIMNSGGGSNDWCRDCGGAVVIRMIW